MESGFVTFRNGLYHWYYKISVVIFELGGETIWAALDGSWSWSYR